MRSGPGRLPGRDVYRAGTFTGPGRLPGRDVYRAGTFTGPGRLPGRAVYRAGPFTGPGRLPGRAVYRAGPFTGPGRLPGRAVYRAGPFTGPGRLSSGIFILNFTGGIIVHRSSRDVYFVSTAKILNMVDRNSQVQFQSLLSLGWSATSLLNTTINLPTFRTTSELASHLTKQHNIFPRGQGEIKYLYGKNSPTQTGVPARLAML